MYSIQQANCLKWLLVLGFVISGNQSGYVHKVQTWTAKVFAKSILDVQEVRAIMPPVLISRTEVNGAFEGSTVSKAARAYTSPEIRYRLWFGTEFHERIKGGS